MKKLPEIVLTKIFLSALLVFMITGQGLGETYSWFNEYGQFISCSGSRNYCVEPNGTVHQRVGRYGAVIDKDGTIKMDYNLYGKNPLLNKQNENLQKNINAKPLKDAKWYIEQGNKYFKKNRQKSIEILGKGFQLLKQNKLEGRRNEKINMSGYLGRLLLARKNYKKAYDIFFEANKIFKNNQFDDSLDYLIKNHPKKCK
jgi:tetratricopeptide (TPR) repeat protein